MHCDMEPVAKGPGCTISCVVTAENNVTVNCGLKNLTYYGNKQKFGALYLRLGTA